MTQPSWQNQEVQARLSLVDQALPRYRENSLEIGLDYDPDVSADHFIISFFRYCPGEIDPVEEMHRICRAFDLNRRSEDRQMYLREMCTMVSPLLQHGYTLADLSPILVLIAKKWDMLATFLALDDFLSKQATRYHMVPIQNSLNLTVEQEVNALFAALRLNGKES